MTNLQALLTPKLLLAYTGKGMDAREEAVKRVIKSTDVAKSVKAGVLAEMFVANHLAESVLFVVDHGEVQEAIGSLDAPPRLPELPPLPFPKIAVEASEDVGWTTHWHRDSGVTTTFLDICLIAEEEQGQTWIVMMFGRQPADGPQEYERVLSIFTISANGKVEIFNPATKELSDVTSDKFLAGYAQRFPVEVAHLITASGVSVSPVPVPRQTRRSFERRGTSHPAVYLVSIRDGVDDRKGVSDRTYTCRWLVRGHWRHYKSGRKTWVRPYVKGPPGAPWRGRPVYVKEAA